MLPENRKAFVEGVRDGLPICFGYFVVAFALGVIAKNAGLTPFQGFLASLLNNASAGEFAGFMSILTGAAYVEIAMVTLVANARYLLMSAVVSQKFSPDTPFFHRFFVGFDLTDEIFGITIAREGYLNPFYNYGAMSVALPGWSLGTAGGVIVGDTLPGAALAAFGVALYGMFLAIIIPPANKDKAICVAVVASFAASFAAANVFPDVSGVTRTIILTILISGIAAVVHPPEKDVA